MMYSSLSTSGPIKWNHNQESTLFQHASPFEPAYDGRSTATLAERARELYMQFLWLPEVRVFFSPPTTFRPTRTYYFTYRNERRPVHDAARPIRPHDTTARPAAAFCIIIARQRRAPAAPCARRHSDQRELVHLQISRTLAPERPRRRRLLLTRARVQRHGRPRGVHHALRSGALCTM